MKTKHIIRPCAHCGGTDFDLEDFNVNALRPPVAVRCLDCGATGKCSDMVEQAVTEWNRRDREDDLCTYLQDALQCLIETGNSDYQAFITYGAHLIQQGKGGLYDGYGYDLFKHDDDDEQQTKE